MLSHSARVMFFIAAIIWAFDRGARGGGDKFRIVQKTLLGQAFFNFAVKANEDEEDNITSE